MALVIITSKGNELEWQKHLRQLQPEIDIRIYPNDSNREEVEFALAWNPPSGVFRKYPNLNGISSTGAGVDHILKDPELPDDIQISRVVDERLSKDMSAYLVTYVMAHLRSTGKYDRLKAAGNWQRTDYAVPEDTRIGILGMGQLGQHVARQLSDLGFMVSGWSKTGKTHPNVQNFAGREELAAFLGDVNILICLLPLTSETRNILSMETFRLLPKGAYIINVARGEHLVEDDLIEAIGAGQLSGACLDVFRSEPLPKDHPFWANEKITITPHVASITNIAHVAPQIIDNYRRVKMGQPMLNPVSREAGY